MAGEGGLGHALPDLEALGPDVGAVWHGLVNVGGHGLRGEGDDFARGGDQLTAGQLSQKVVVKFSECTPSWRFIWWDSIAAMVRPRPR